MIFSSAMVGFLVFGWTDHQLTIRLHVWGQFEAIDFSGIPVADSADENRIAAGLAVFRAGSYRPPVAMKTELLREWLNLPPGPWPPGDRELLGFADGEAVESNLVEIRALERMELLRPRQLIEPDLVTEGMNRLAQAMIALSAVSAPVAKKPKKPVRERTPVEIRRPMEVNLDIGTPKPTVAPSTATMAMPAVLEAEVLSLALDEAIPESVAVVAEDRVSPVLLEPIVIPEPPPGAIFPPSPRRLGYRNLARLRHRLDAWTKFRPILGDPAEPLTTPAKIATYLEAIASLRREMRKRIDQPFPEHGGQLVLVVVNHATPLSLLRDLQPGQRIAVARDWAIGEADLRAKVVRVRKSLAKKAPKRNLIMQLRSVFGWLIRNPEWLLVVLILAMLVVGRFRSR
jgi:hypothetical protein